MGCGNSAHENRNLNKSVRPSDNKADSDHQNGVHNFLVIQDDVTQTTKCIKTDLPEGDVGDGKLGVTEYQKVEMILSKLSPGELYCDPDFPADNSALYYSDNHRFKDITWARPQDVVPAGKQPRLLVDGISRDDIKQGILGDCWFLSSCAAVSQHDNLMSKIIPEDQPLFGADYKGVVRFRFWRFGEWIDVYIDDRLPVRNNQLIYARCEDPTEYWVALIEKAYAKIHGSYEAIEGGQTMDALVDLTGGLAERYEIKEVDFDMYKLLLKAHLSGAFIACTKKGDWRQALQADANGLVSGHAYTVTAVNKIKHSGGEEHLLRIRNPWGNETEWIGAWSDSDKQWNLVDGTIKRKLGVEVKADGEFWMSFQDFCDQFQEITICTTQQTGINNNKHVGFLHNAKGYWIPGQTAGGSRNDIEMYATNPQYLLTLTKPDIDFDGNSSYTEKCHSCSVVISLMQEHRRSKRYIKVKAHQIAFTIYKATPGIKKRLPVQHFRTNYETAISGVYINLREVSGRFELHPGSYVVIPSTFKPDQPGTFMLRTFAQNPFSLTGPLK